MSFLLTFCSLQRLLDYSSDFTLSQFRLVMNIICSIAYSDPPCEQLKDHIDMMVKKQVSSSIRNVKNRGIVGVVRVIDHMVWERITSDQDDLESSYNTIESLPTKLSRVAATYIGKIHSLLHISFSVCPKQTNEICFKLLQIWQSHRHKVARSIWHCFSMNWPVCSLSVTKIDQAIKSMGHF